MCLQARAITCYLACKGFLSQSKAPCCAGQMRYSWNGIEYATGVSYALVNAAKTPHKAQQVSS